MNSILIYSKDYKTIKILEGVSDSLKFNVKTVMDCDMAEKLLLNRAYDFLVIGDEINIIEQERLASALWKKSPNAPFILFIDKDGKKQFARERLLGLEIVGPDNAKNNLKMFLEKLAPEKNAKDDNLEILYVEDLDSPREIISMYLENLNKGSVTSLASAKDALNLLHENPHSFNCIVTDLKMPEMNGHEFIKELRADSNFNHIPIIVLTAYGTLDWLIKCIESGASGFLVKPPKKDSIKFELNRAKRINNYGLNPRLVKSKDAEAVRKALEEKFS